MLGSGHAKCLNSYGYGRTETEVLDHGSDPAPPPRFRRAIPYHARTSHASTAAPSDPESGPAASPGGRCPGRRIWSSTGSTAANLQLVEQPTHRAGPGSRPGQAGAPAVARQRRGGPRRRPGRDAGSTTTLHTRRPHPRSPARSGAAACSSRHRNQAVSRCHGGICCERSVNTRCGHDTAGHR
jgi:hypothetical protein